MLPPQIEWNAELVGLISTATLALGRLAGRGQSLPNPHILIGMFKRQEAVASSRIEGTQTTLSDLVLFEAFQEGEPPRPDTQEVLNYVKALDYGLDRLATLPLSKRLIAEVHRILMEGVRGHERTPGEFRRSQNFIGHPGCGIADATFVPPPPNDVHAALDAFEEFLQSPSDLPTLVRLAMIHYQFEAIHPFLDGNGRVGRLLITLLLCAEGVLPGPLLYLSEFIDRHRQEYYRRLLGVSQNGEWNDWISFFLRGVAAQASDAVDRAENLLRIRDEYHHRLQRVGANARTLRLVDELLAAPAMSISRAASILETSWSVAVGHIDKLVAVGILREATGRSRNRVYVADEIIRAATETMLQQTTTSGVGNLR
ncbi:MAG: Fic family protein [Phycisphaerales bacterium]|nr:Fic family protein [Phycisphaerales bacterium]MCI0629220.1 Fic family protein [Phycisphaerales bacterium]MCI0676031.1 Fic family protein [Phycisphaerales bacterium]